MINKYNNESVYTNCYFPLPFCPFMTEEQLLATHRSTGTPSITTVLKHIHPALPIVTGEENIADMEATEEIVPTL